METTTYTQYAVLLTKNEKTVLNDAATLFEDFGTLSPDALDCLVDHLLNYIYNEDYSMDDLSELAADCPKQKLPELFLGVANFLNALVHTCADKKDE